MRGILEVSLSESSQIKEAASARWQDQARKGEPEESAVAGSDVVFSTATIVSNNSASSHLKPTGGNVMSGIAMFSFVDETCAV